MVVFGVLAKVMIWSRFDDVSKGRLAQLAARVLSMHEVAGSIPATSNAIAPILH